MTRQKRLRNCQKKKKKDIPSLCCTWTIGQQFLSDCQFQFNSYENREKNIIAEKGKECNSTRNRPCALEDMIDVVINVIVNYSAVSGENTLYEALNKIKHWRQSKQCLVVNQA